MKLFGLYVHWPFCASKCPYCDFNSHVAATIDHDAWLRAYEVEIAHYAGLTPGRMLTSIFFGGGTPSLMQPKTVEAVINAARKHWAFAPDIEITLEANPTSIEREKFQAFRNAGVNRVSVGVQALNEADLKFLGRQHDTKEALIALETAASTFDRFSYDLIYARPEQSVAAWREELSRALSIARGHLSLYQLTIEQGTPFYARHARGEFRIPDGDQGGEFYEATQEIMDSAHMPAYEISNHAEAGQESRHNLAYWRYADYVGVGPGAHGRLTLNGEKKATRGHRAPDIWLKRVAEQGHGAHPFEDVTPQERFTEGLMMGLRLRDGVNMAYLSEEARRDWKEIIDLKKVQSLEGEGLLVLDGAMLRPTAAGMQRLNGILAYLL